MAKHFRPVNFTIEIKFKVTNEMWLLIKKEAENYNSKTDFYRSLFKKHLNCNDYGKKENENEN